jgi:hypothetical protein
MKKKGNGVEGEMSEKGKKGRNNGRKKEKKGGKGWWWKGEKREK